MRLLVETDIESGLRWGELTELRVKDLDRRTGIFTITRVVVELKAKDRPTVSASWSRTTPRTGVAPRQDRHHLVHKLAAYIAGPRPHT